MKSISKNIYVQLALGLVVFVCLVWGSIVLLSRHSSNYADDTVAMRDLTEVVTGNGSVLPDDSVNLAFNLQGRVAAVTAVVGSTTVPGEVLARLDTSSIEASLAGAEADVEAARAKLATLERGARPEDLALYEQKYEDASAALVVAMKNAYLGTEDAITGKTDTLFLNSNSANPTINIRTQNPLEAININNERLNIGSKLDAWKTLLATLPTNPDESSLRQAKAMAEDALVTAKGFLNDLGTIANNMTVNNSGLSQTSIDADTALVNAAATEVTGATNAETNALAAWNTAHDSLTLEKAGSTAEDITAGQAAVDKTMAIVSGLESELHQAEIISPFAGVITAVNVKVGQVYVPGISADAGISLISQGHFKIEIYVPETDIGKIEVGQVAEVTFDAYGPGIKFPAHVTLVDPAQTIEQGVNAYKVTLGFDNPNDSRLKSGLTANVAITTKSLDQTLAIPSRDIVRHGTDTFVLAKNPVTGAYINKPVQTGITSSDGYTQVISGLRLGEAVAGFGAAGE